MGFKTKYFIRGNFYLAYLMGINIFLKIVKKKVFHSSIFWHDVE